MLSDSNETMVIVMDSVMKTQKLFAEVGAAHLPGKKENWALEKLPITAVVLSQLWMASQKLRCH